MNAPTRGAAVYPAAELDRRFYAYALDRVVVWGIYAAVVLVAVRFLFAEGRTVLGITSIALTVLLVGIAQAALLGTRGTSPGKALVGLRVVDHHSGTPIGFSAALLRGGILGVAALPTVGLGVATLAWTAVMDPGGWRRGWHDHRTGSVVIDVRPVPLVETPGAGRPRQMVNLTAMRLMSTAQVAAATAGSQLAPTEPVPIPRSAGPVPMTPRPSGPPPSSPPLTGPMPMGPPPTGPPPSTRPPSSPPRPVSPRAPVGTGGEPDNGATRRREPITPAPQPVPVPGTSVNWRVVFDSGEDFIVEGLALVGRRPEPRPGETVRHVVPLRSADMSISKTHAQFQVTPDGVLVVMDRGSTNGSTIVRQGIAKPLAAGRPATLVEADIVRFGDRSMTVKRN